jgi:hypothetical protein
MKQIQKNSNVKLNTSSLESFGFACLITFYVMGFNALSLALLFVVKLNICNYRDDIKIFLGTLHP